jgi:hypothetical protein
MSPIGITGSDDEDDGDQRRDPQAVSESLGGRSFTEATLKVTVNEV